MIKYSKYISIILFGLLLTFSACEEKEYKLETLVSPTNVKLDFSITGQDVASTELENGDGTGFVQFSASADNAITYNYIFGDGKESEIAPEGKVTHRYTETGIHTYNVTVIAIGTGGISSSTSASITVYSSFEDPEAVKFLAGENIGDSKTWYWASNLPAHAGMGPAYDDYGASDYAWPNWWQISPWDEAKSCMYSAEFVFTNTASGLTFEQTKGPAFIPGGFAAEIGVDGDQCHDETVATTMFGVKNVSFTPSSSKASQATEIAVPYRGTSFTISDGGFMCWYVGKSEYDIIEISDKILKVRIQENETQAWYHIFTSEKPVQ